MVRREIAAARTAYAGKENSAPQNGLSMLLSAAGTNGAPANASEKPFEVTPKFYFSIRCVF